MSYDAEDAGIVLVESEFMSIDSYLINAQSSQLNKNRIDNGIAWNMRLANVFIQPQMIPSMESITK